jgi:hypothetical protein
MCECLLKVLVPGWRSGSSECVPIPPAKKIELQTPPTFSPVPVSISVQGEVCSPQLFQQYLK